MLSLGKETDYSFNDAKAGMGFHYDCGRKNEKFFDSRHRSATENKKSITFLAGMVFILWNGLFLIQSIE